MVVVARYRSLGISAISRARLKEDKMRGKLRLASIICVAILLRCCVTQHPHSGEGKPPMYGDYEAQRHWQEITLNLPSRQWYVNTTDNDLQYWGLDYPPLTAYHSLLLGRVASSIDPSFVKLHESRGIETAEHKHFMRLTVLIADALIYIPAVVFFFVTDLRSQSDRRTLDESGIFKFGRGDVVLLTALIYPGLILIDHGHFQYNCVSLGLLVVAVAAVTRDSFVAGSILFVLALNYKQMELYHALPFFLYILGSHTPGRVGSLARCARALTRVSFAVLSTFYVVWLPFLRNGDLLAATVLRLFPFARGVFEDKVANVWCAINVVVKLRETFTNTQLAGICLAATACAILPCCVNLYRSPGKNAFVVALINSALAFFLFSFQVHEKSILLVAVPVLLHFHNDPLPCFWFLIVSHFSMLPLFIKDGLYLAYLGTTVLYFFSVLWMWPGMFRDDGASDSSRRSSGSRSEVRAQKRKKSRLLPKLPSYGKRSWLLAAFCGSIAGVSLLSVLGKFAEPPERYPDLFPLLISIYSCGHFLIFFAYFNYVQLFALRREFADKVKSR